jgi:transcription elongation factor Elf1
MTNPYPKKVKLNCKHCNHIKDTIIHWNGSILWVKCESCKKDTRYEFDKGELTSSVAK